MLDEKTLRRPEFDEAMSTPVVLGDGQAWYFPKPVTWTWLPVVGEDRRAKLTGFGSFGPDYEKLVERLDEAEEFGDRITGAFDLAINLLDRNYVVPVEGFAKLLPFRLGDETNQAMWQQILAVARGFDVKEEFGPKKA